MINYFRTFQETLNHPNNRDHKLKTVFRIIFWKFNQLFFHLPALVEIEKGIRCICYPESSYGSMVVYSKWPEYDVIHDIVTTLSGNDVYIDVGANFGDTTLVAASHTRGKIYAFEPSPSAYSQLIDNILLNNLSTQIVPVQAVASDQNGKISFLDEERSEVSHIASVDKKSNLSVKSYTLDTFAKLHQLKTIKLLKIDVEGAELIVLRGAHDLLSSHKIKHIILELNYESEKFGYKNSDTVKYLRKMGYKIKNVPRNIDERIVNIHAQVV